jgi:hypothetical protein
MNAKAKERAYSEQVLLTSLNDTEIGGMFENGGR